MSTYVFTSIAANYVPKARVLAESVKRRSPEVKFCLLLAEKGSFDALSAPEFDQIVTLEDLGIDDLSSWAFRLSLVELCTAIKGAFLRALLARPDCERVFYFDPDMVVLCEVDELARRFSDGPILLTPHLTEPDKSVEGILDNEMSALRHGTYNLGFLAVANSDQGRSFADWWWRRLQLFCHDDIPRGLFTDQRWVDLAPAFFEGVVIVRDPGWNVATWNLAHRHVEGMPPEDLRVNGRPLRFYHFSGLDSGAQLAMLDKYGSAMGVLYQMRDWYLERCSHFERSMPTIGEWSLGRFDNGEEIQRHHRLLYRLREDLQRAFPDPYSTRDINASYSDWFRVNHEPLMAKSSGEGTDQVDELQRQLAFYQGQLASLLSSRSWRFVQSLRRWLAPLRRRPGRGPGGLR